MLHYSCSLHNKMKPLKLNNTNGFVADGAFSPLLIGECQVVEETWPAIDMPAFGDLGRCGWVQADRTQGLRVTDYMLKIINKCNFNFLSWKIPNSSRNAQTLLIFGNLRCTCTPVRYTDHYNMEWVNSLFLNQQCLEFKNGECEYSQLARHFPILPACPGQPNTARSQCHLSAQIDS